MPERSESERAGPQRVKPLNRRGSLPVGPALVVGSFAAVLALGVSLRPPADESSEDRPRRVSEAERAVARARAESTAIAGMRESLAAAEVVLQRALPADGQLNREDLRAALGSIREKVTAAREMAPDSDQPNEIRSAADALEMWAARAERDPSWRDTAMAERNPSMRAAARRGELQLMLQGAAYVRRQLQALTDDTDQRLAKRTAELESVRGRPPRD